MLNAQRLSAAQTFPVEEVAEGSREEGARHSQQSSQQSSLQSSHEDDSTRFLTPLIREERSDSAADKIR
ncbi:hypothetical protein D9C73_015382 [Collichthys lucidus]|uniref:Uncharacterized protein n=1 Tax=Collichthys lucidus TaxID=240159 RepID=A0A4U5V0R7_COLLU|nr:hypothetical protein D9C73_015382 [Collichthys lucidus]